MKVKKRILLVVLLCTVFVPFTSAASTLFSLTNDPGKERVQDWCLNGSKILYISDETGNRNIYSMNPDGRSRYQITTSSSDDRAADCNLSGNTIVYSSQEGGYSDIWIINIDGTNPQQLTNDLFVDLRPSMSPDGAKIAFSSDRGGAFNIWTMNIDGSNLQQITSGVRDTAPQWSPDGSQIVYHSGLSGDSDIFVMNTDGTNQRQLTYDPTWAVLPSWSPDGSRIVFLSNRTGNRDIWTVDADGGNLTQLTTDVAQDSGSSWSPDGAKIAITSDRAGTQDIWVYEFSDEPVSLSAPQLSYSVDGVSVSLSWSDVPGATGYTLYYAPVTDTGYGNISSKDMGASTSFNYTLWEGAAFYVAVKAYNDQESSAYSNVEIINIEPVSVLPEIPELSVTTTDLDLFLSWTEIPEATGYILSYAPTSSYTGPESFITKDLGGQTSFSATLWDGAAFTVAVQAYNEQGNSTYSNIEQFTIERLVDVDNDSDGYTENQGDCDDTTAAISPIAEEICGDGIDQDCSGSDEICTVSYPSGEYLAVIYQYEQGAEATAYSLISMDGSSSVLRQQMIIWPDILGQSVPANLELQSDGSYSMENGDHGYISQDQEVLIQSDTNPTDGDINITTNVKKSSGKTSADFSGQYYLVGYINETEYIWTDIYEMVCGQTGNCPFDQLMTSGPYPLESGSFDFTISSDGTMTFEDEVKGIMSPDESFMAFGAGFMLDESQGSIFVIRQASGLSNADLKGKYAVVEYNNFPETNYLEFVFDGSGNVYYTGQYGSFGSPITGASTYTLAEDGFLTIHSFRGKTMLGALSSDKEEFTVVHLGDSSPGIMFGVK